MSDFDTFASSVVGLPSGPPFIGPYPVNEPMISHWVEAMGDTNPVYTSAVAAQAAGLGGIIAPPTMLQAWIMRGLRPAPTDAKIGPLDQLMQRCDEEGFTSVVATNCDQDYVRPLVPGERIAVSSVIESVSEQKTTGLGVGRFLTTKLEYVAIAASATGSTEELIAGGEPVATMRFRILKFAPRARPSTRPPRPRPAITQDNAMWFEGLRAHEMRLQRCASCGTLRHPPLPACANCRSFETDYTVASGQGELYSYVVVHYPKVESFDYPRPIGLIALEEGPRVVAELVGVDLDDVVIGAAMQAEYIDCDDELSVVAFRPRVVA